MKCLRILAFASSFSLVLSAAAQMRQSTNFITFDVPEADETDANGGTFPCCINTAGTITGTYTDANRLQHGFVRKGNGRITAFDVPNSFQILAVHGINESGAIVGEYFDNSFMVHGFVRSPSGHISSFDGPDAGLIPGLGTQARAINQLGVIAGDFWDGNTVAHGFIRTPDGRITTFDAPGAGSTPGSFQGTYVNSINAHGILSGGYSDSASVGHQFVLSPSGMFSTYDAPDAIPGGTLSTSINSEGAVTGHYFDGTNKPHGFLRSPNGAITEFDPPGAVVGTYSNRINLFGTLVGIYGDQNNVWHGYTRGADGNFVTFDAPGVGNAPGQGTGASCVGNTVQFVSCVAINLRGVIAGEYLDGNNVSHGFVTKAEEKEE